MVTCLSQLPELDPPAHLRAKILERLEEKESWRSRVLEWVTLRRLPVSLSLAGTALAAMLVIAVGVWMGPEGLIDLTRKPVEVDRVSNGQDIAGTVVEDSRIGGDEVAPAAPSTHGEDLFAKNGHLSTGEPPAVEEKRPDRDGDFYGGKTGEAVSALKGGGSIEKSGAEGIAARAPVRPSKAAGYRGTAAAPTGDGAIRVSPAAVAKEAESAYGLARKELPEEKGPLGRTSTAAAESALRTGLPAEKRSQEKGALAMSRALTPLETGTDQEQNGRYEQAAKTFGAKGVPVPGQSVQPAPGYSVQEEGAVGEVMAAEPVPRKPPGTSSLAMEQAKADSASSDAGGQSEAVPRPVARPAERQQIQAEAVNGVEVAERARPAGERMRESSRPAREVTPGVLGKSGVPVSSGAAAGVREDDRTKDSLVSLGYLGSVGEGEERTADDISAEGRAAGSGEAQDRLDLPTAQLSVQLKQAVPGTGGGKSEYDEVSSQVARLSEVRQKESSEAAVEQDRRSGEKTLGGTVQTLADRPVAGEEVPAERLPALEPAVADLPDAVVRTPEGETAEFSKGQRALGDFQVGSGTGGMTAETEAPESLGDEMGESRLSRGMLESIHAQELREPEQRNEEVQRKSGKKRVPAVAFTGALYWRSGVETPRHYDLILETKNVPELYQRMNQVAVSNYWVFAAPSAEGTAGVATGAGGWESQRSMEEAQRDDLQVQTGEQKAREAEEGSRLSGPNGVEYSFDTSPESPDKEAGEGIQTWDAEKPTNEAAVHGRIEDATREVLVWVPYEQRTYALTEFVRLNREVPEGSSASGGSPVTGGPIEAGGDTVSATASDHSFGNGADNDEEALWRLQGRRYTLDAARPGESAMGVVSKDFDDIDSTRIRFYGEDAGPGDVTAQQNLPVSESVSETGGRGPLRILIRRSNGADVGEPPAPLLDVNRPPDASERPLDVDVRPPDADER